nr:DUF896 domain-containing protein [bacterium]
MPDELIARINQLAHKAKAQGLTQEEQQERDQLRKLYLERFRRNARASLDGIVLARPDGSRIALKDIRLKEDKQHDPR